MSNILGHGSFLVGFLLAIFAGLMPSLQNLKIVWVIVILGLVVGFLNITAEETAEFLLAGISLVICAGAANMFLPLGLIINSILNYIIAFVVPAALVVALKTIWVLAKD